MLGVDVPYLPPHVKTLRIWTNYENDPPKSVVEGATCPSSVGAPEHAQQTKQITHSLFISCS